VRWRSWLGTAARDNGLRAKSGLDQFTIGTICSLGIQGQREVVVPEWVRFRETIPKCAGLQEYLMGVAVMNRNISWAIAGTLAAVMLMCGCGGAGVVAADYSEDGAERFHSFWIASEFAGDTNAV
jgi:hypothetical protein